MFQLRDYQEDFVGGLRAEYQAGHRSVLGVLPTGGGKTVCFSHIANVTQARRRRTTILTHREELLEQVSGTLAEMDTEHGIISAGAHYDRRYLTHVASVFTLARRLDRIEVPDLCIIDEAHHAIAGSTWGSVLANFRQRNPAMHVLGVTATPERLSGEGLIDTFQTMVVGPTTRQLIERNALAPYRIFAPEHKVDLSGLHSRAGDFVKAETTELMSKPGIVGDAIAHYKKHLNGAPAAAFCCSVEHAKLIAERFRTAGFRAASIDGGMDKGVRRALVEDVRRGALNVITSCDLMSEGFDCPGLFGAILLRPTQSLSLYLQQIGRALRRLDGKEHAIILDHVNNSSLHGLPDDDRVWSLQGREKKRKGSAEGRSKTCKKCLSANQPSALHCRDCGAPFETESREVLELEGTLSEIEVKRMRQEAAETQLNAKSFEQLMALGKIRGYKNPYTWAKSILKARADKHPKEHLSA